MSFHCSNPVDNALGDQRCTYQDDKPETIAGIPLKEFQLFYFGEKLSMIVLRFDAAAFEAVTDAISKKYGSGKITERSMIQNKMGAKFDNIVMQWRVNDSRIVAERYDRNVDESLVKFTSTAGEAELERRGFREKKTRENDI